MDKANIKLNGDHGPFSPLAFQAEGVLLLPVSVGLSICPSVCL